MKFDLLLEQLGSATGLDGVALDASGNCTLRFDGEHDITFTGDAEDRAILLHSEVGDAAGLSSESYRALLQASLLGAETGGSSLSVYGDPGIVVLWKRYNDAFEDYSSLEQAINRFLGQTIFWKNKLVSMHQENLVSSVSGNIEMVTSVPESIQMFALRV